MSAALPFPQPMLDVARIRADFPALDQSIHGKPLVYLDNAATAQTPRPVIDAMLQFYERDCANIHRGVHTLSGRATDAYEGARTKVQRFLGAERADEIVFVRGTTEAINLVAHSFLAPRLRSGDEIVLTQMEHHSNILPWQALAEKQGAVLRVAPINERGELDLEAFSRLLGPRTRLVSIAHVSNALGTINPVRNVVRMAQEQGIPVLIDGAQAVPHLAIDVQALGCDFYAFSGHKLYGPTGIGVLYARREHLLAMQPYQTGGGMIRSVTFDKTLYADAAYRFEAGTPHVAGAIGLGAAVDYVAALPHAAVVEHEALLLQRTEAALREIPGVRLIGTARAKSAVCSFVVEGLHPHDVGTLLDLEGVAVRVGHHCAQPLMEYFKVPATVRASFGIYNTADEIGALVAGLHKAKQVLGGAT